MLLDISFHSVAVGFAILRSQRWIGEFKRLDGSIHRNLRELTLFISYVHAECDFETPWLWDVNHGNNYISLAVV